MSTKDTKFITVVHSWCIIISSCREKVVELTNTSNKIILTLCNS